uniref:Uncharacterized protein n=1 Tax=Rhizophora mucronata TaxID=61149 RepID=A0A2P2J123_RHIMU
MGSAVFCQKGMIIEHFGFELTCKELERSPQFSGIVLFLLSFCICRCEAFCPLFLFSVLGYILCICFSNELFVHVI